jgi:hypothetical protein
MNAGCDDVVLDFCRSDVSMPFLAMQKKVSSCRATPPACDFK